MLRKMAIPAWRHTCNLKNRGVSHLGLVFWREDGDCFSMWKGTKIGSLKMYVPYPHFIIKASMLHSIQSWHPCYTLYIQSFFITLHSIYKVVQGHLVSLEQCILPYPKGCLKKNCAKKVSSKICFSKKFKCLKRMWTMCKLTPKTEDSDSANYST